MQADKENTQLLEAFLAASPRNIDVSDRCAVENSLQALLRQGLESWPSLQVSAHDFVVFVAEKIPDETPVLEAMGQLHASDLYLAFACLHSAPGAMESLLNAHAAHIRQNVFAAMRLDESKIGELEQLWQERLFMPSDRGLAKISQYAGRGPLRKWLAMVAKRTALNHLRGVSKYNESHSSVEVLAELPDLKDAPDLALMRRQYRAQFREALYAAIASLTPRQRTLLRFYFVDGLSTVEIGRAFQVNHSTVSRWLMALKNEISQGTRRELQRTLDLDPWQVESLVRMLSSQLDVSLGGLLGDENGLGVHP